MTKYRVDLEIDTVLKTGTVIGVTEELSTPVAQPSVAPVAIQSAPEVKPSVAPAPSGMKGSKTNPFKLKPTTKGFNTYIPEVCADGGMGDIVIPQGGKYYFEIDPLGVFAVHGKFYEGAGQVCRVMQDKTTGDFSVEDCWGSDSLLDIMWSPVPNKKYLYALVGSPDGVVHDAFWVQMPFNP